MSFRDVVFFYFCWVQFSLELGQPVCNDSNWLMLVETSKLSGEVELSFFFFFFILYLFHHSEGRWHFEEKSLQTLLVHVKSHDRLKDVFNINMCSIISITKGP